MKVNFTRLSDIEEGDPLNAVPVATSLIELQTGTNTINAEQLGNDIDGNGLEGGNGAALAVKSDTISGGTIVAANIVSDGVGVDADDVGEAMTSTGADAIAATITSTGADAIGTIMSNAGANAIGQTMTATGVDAITAGIGISNLNFKTDTSGDRDNSSWGYEGSGDPSGISTTVVGSWTDFVCDTYWGGTIPSGEILAIIFIQPVGYVSVRPKGMSWDQYGIDASTPTISSHPGMLLIRTDTDHIFEYWSDNPGNDIYFLGYIPIKPQ